MATELFYFKGTCKWAQVYRPDDKYDNFKITVYMDDESMALFKQSGLQLTPKEDEDGTFVCFRRPNYKQIKKDLVHFGAPKVINAEGAPITDSIGNGSDVVVKVVAYSTAEKGKGHRLDTVQVTKLIPYEGSEAPAATMPKGVEAF